MLERELATHEQAMEILNSLAASFQIVTISRVKGILTSELLRQALDRVQMRHPYLNARIVPTANSFRFASGADKIPLSVVAQDWQEVVTQELNQKIAAERGLLRVVLVKVAPENYYLMTTIHHAIADASSCIQLHSEILTNCDVNSAASTNITTLPAFPSVDKLMPKSMQGFAGDINSIVYLVRIKLQLLRYKPITLGFEKIIPIESRKCGMVHRQINSELTAGLVDICRQRQTTVQGALGAAMLFAVAKELNIVDNKNTYCSFRSSISLRPRLQPPVSQEHLGTIASAILSFHNMEKIDFWDLARDIKYKLEIGLAKGDGFRQVLTFKKIIKHFLNEPNQSVVTAGLTNIGRVTIPHSYGEFELEEISFVPAQSVFGGIFTAAVSTFKGKMLLNFMFSEPSMSKKTVEALADDMIAEINKQCQNN